MLSQLSYSPDTVGLDRVELSTSRLSGVRSNHLSYRPGGSIRTSGGLHLGGVAADDRDVLENSCQRGADRGSPPENWIASLRASNLERSPRAGSCFL
jgi:hypothetical protein